jgi:hypothetical protein
MSGYQKAGQKHSKEILWRCGKVQIFTECHKKM